MAAVAAHNGVTNPPGPTLVLDHLHLQILADGVLQESTSGNHLSTLEELPLMTGQVKNLEERIKPDQLKEALAEIFSEYGNVIDLVAKTNLKAKGQAFIVFDETEAAERAIKEVQGFELFDKPMLLDFARTKSDATVWKQGSTEDFETHKRRRLAEKGTITLLLLFKLHANIKLPIFQRESKHRKPPRPRRIYSGQQSVPLQKQVLYDRSRHPVVLV